jgi:HlyD family secretion protein
MERLALRAPFDGMVVVKDTHRPDGSRVALAKGDDIRPGQPVLHVVDPGSMEVLAQVNQTEVMRFKPGQEAAISLDGFPGAGYRGTVVSIGWLAQPPGRQQFSVRTVPVRIRLHDADDRVLPDLSAAADVLVERLESALIVPASAVRQESGKPYVVVANGSGEEKRDVTVGPVQGNETAILDGLAEGEILLLPVSGPGSIQ